MQQRPQPDSRGRAYHPRERPILHRDHRGRGSYKIVAMRQKSVTNIGEEVSKGGINRVQQWKREARKGKPPFWPRSARQKRGQVPYGKNFLRTHQTDQGAISWNCWGNPNHVTCLIPIQPNTCSKNSKSPIFLRVVLQIWESW